MTNIEAMKLVENVIKIHWPDWDIKKQQLETWIKFLKPFDYKAVEQATQSHYASQQGSYKKPKLYAIIENAKRYQQHQPKTVKKKIEPETDVFVQCIEHERPERVYTFYAIYVTLDRQENRDYVLAAAENTRKKVENLYSGKWIIVQKTTHSKMTDMMQKHRETKLVVHS